MLQHLKWSSLWQLLTAESCELLIQGTLSYIMQEFQIPSGNWQYS